MSPTKTVLVPFTEESQLHSPLHQQKVKGREIVITEDLRLYLVWIYNRVFIKPLPRYLLSYIFWSEHISNEKSLLQGSTQEEQETCSTIRILALGFLRTYYHLIQHESDFEIARNETRLLPPDVTWTEFCAFSKRFPDISDNAVLERYYYGELRLTRLNLYTRFIIRKFHYERVHGQYSAFFARFYGPLLFIFGILSIVLSAMQVELGIETLTNTHQQTFWYTSQQFVIVTLVCIALLILGLSLKRRGILLYIIEYERNSLKIIGYHPPLSVTLRDLISHLKTLSHLDEKPFLHSVQILYLLVLLD